MSNPSEIRHRLVRRAAMVGLDLYQRDVIIHGIINATREDLDDNRILVQLVQALATANAEKLKMLVETAWRKPPEPMVIEKCNLQHVSACVDNRPKDKLTDEELIERATDLIMVLRQKDRESMVECANVGNPAGVMAGFLLAVQRRQKIDAAKGREISKIEFGTDGVDHVTFKDKETMKRNFERNVIRGLDTEDLQGS